MNVVVLGAAGFLGINLVDELLSRGVVPLCARRQRTNTIPLRSRKVPLVTVDLDEPASLDAAFAGVDVVFHCAGHYPRTSLRPDDAMQLGLGQLDRVLDAAARTGVRRLVYVSSTATVAPSSHGPSDESDVFDRAPGLGVYHDLKWAMEARAAAEERVEVVIACPGACIGPWDLRVGTSALLVALARGMDPAHPDGTVSIVDSGDVALALAQLGLTAEVPRRVLLSGGSQRLHELLVRLATRYRVPTPSAPMDADAALAFADAEERRAEAEGGRARLSREIADLVVHGVPVSASLSERALGMTYTPLDTTLDRFDAWARRMKIIPHLQELT